MHFRTPASFENIRIGALNTRRLIFKAFYSKQLDTMSKESCKVSEALDKVSDVEIDGRGQFKYILVKVYDKPNVIAKYIVRGTAKAVWHVDIYGDVQDELRENGRLSFKCIGGGTIEHDPDQKAIKVYGVSKCFGGAEHNITAGILKKKYPDYSVTYTDA